jgi:NAD(P)-dependent dehydrogenase (short-subunit alcohol dehydrogenase family)
VDGAVNRSRTCLVTGASRGIGAAVAARLADDGHRVALLGRDAGALESVAATLPSPSLTLPADVTDPEQTEEAFLRVEREWGPVEVLVSNAGSGAAAPLAETTDEVWARMIELNLTAPFRLLRRAVRPMVASGWGRIVVVASVVAKRGEPQVAAYSAAKHGALGLVRAAAAELAPTGVTVNAVCPGYVDTPMTDTTVAAIAGRTGRSQEEARAGLARRQPIGRLIDPAEVAEAVRFCVVNAAVTGQGINVDGGTVQS